MSEELRLKLKSARAKLGLSQSEAASAWGINKKTLISWENDLRTPRGFALTAILEKLDAILAAPEAKAPTKRSRKAD